MAKPHWLIRWDPNDGTPYGTVCRCPAKGDHNGYDEPVDTAQIEQDWTA